MGLRVPWQDQYLIVQSSTISEAKDFSAGGIGIEADKYVLPLTNHPHLSIGQNIISTEKSLGIAERRSGTGYEYQAGTRLPVITLETDCTNQLMGLLGWLFFQNGVTEGASPNYAKECIPWTNPEPEIYCNLVRVMSGSSADSFRIRGGICRNITISGREGEIIKVSSEIVGAYIDNNFNALSAVFNWSERSSGLFQNITARLEVESNGNDFDISDSLSEFSFTINNNVIPKYYNSQNPTSFILGKLTGSFSCVFNWSNANMGGQDAFDTLKTSGYTVLSVTIGSSHFWVYGITRDVEIIDEEQNKIRVSADMAAVKTETHSALFNIIDSINRGIT